MAKTKKPVVSETFDVIVFNDPYEPFYKKLIENELSYSSSPLAALQSGDQCMWGDSLSFFLFSLYLSSFSSCLMLSHLLAYSRLTHARARCYLHGTIGAATGRLGADTGAGGDRAAAGALHPC